MEGHDKIRESVSFFIAVWAFNGGARKVGLDTPSLTFVPSYTYVNGPFVPPRAKIIHSQTNKDTGRGKKIIVGNCHGIF